MIGPIDDPRAALEVAHACDLLDAGTRDTELRHVVDDLEDPSVDVALDTWLVRDDAGAPIAFAIVGGPRPAEVQSSWVKVHPEHRGRGIGSRLLDLVEGRARRRVPAGAPAPALRVEVPATDAAGLDLVGARGYREVRRVLHLVRPLADAPPDPGPPPGGLVARTIDGARDAETVRALDVACFSGTFGYEALPAEAFARAHLTDLDPASVLVLGGGEPAAFVLVRDGEPAWIDVLAVAAGWRRRGIATWLLRRSAADVAARGRRELRLAVDADNDHGARALYDAAGFVERRCYVVLERPLGSAPSEGDAP